MLPTLLPKCYPQCPACVRCDGAATGQNIVIRCTDQAAADKQHTQLTSATPRTKMFIGPITKIFLLIKRIFFPEYLLGWVDSNEASSHSCGGTHCPSSASRYQIFALFS